ncbi:hypothetical protein BDR06DRAFT_776615 [Suillus hirtellus]|nr:hypothetical protein BDR06DRAFT_776615 [Suillus hirtellus]
MWSQTLSGATNEERESESLCPAYPPSRHTAAPSTNTSKVLGCAVSRPKCNSPYNGCHPTCHLKRAERPKHFCPASPQEAATRLGDVSPSQAKQWSSQSIARTKHQLHSYVFRRKATQIKALCQRAYTHPFPLSLLRAIHTNRSTSRLTSRIHRTLCSPCPATVCTMSLDTDSMARQSEADLGIAIFGIFCCATVVLLPTRFPR